jgi:GDP/UDP-N,N'-diacetylbacillosamine 2-epimerase (hydrolysing)
MIKVIDEYAEKLQFVKKFRNLPRVEFVNLLRSASVLVGNSSCGILEAPSLKLPVVNIGSRQKKRQHAENVIFVPHDKEAIKTAINKALNDKNFRKKVDTCTNPYGNGHTGEKIAEILASTDIDNRLLVKDFTY